jgi:hypothetical protein
MITLMVYAFDNYLTCRLLLSFLAGAVFLLQLPHWLAMLR